MIFLSTLMNFLTLVLLFIDLQGLYEIKGNMLVDLLEFDKKKKSKRNSLAL